MSQTIPINSIKDIFTLSEICKNSNEPIYISQNNDDDMVLMNAAIYKETIEKLNIYQQLAVSEQELKENKLYDAFSSLNELQKKYEL